MTVKKIAHMCVQQALQKNFIVKKISFLVQSCEQDFLSSSSGLSGSTRRRSQMVERVR